MNSIPNSIQVFIFIAHDCQVLFTSFNFVQDITQLQNQIFNQVKSRSDTPHVIKSSFISVFLYCSLQSMLSPSHVIGDRNCRAFFLTLVPLFGFIALHG